MSSKKEEREALRRSAADSIRPDWNPQNIDAWNPKEVYYFYMALAKHDLHKSTVSTMDQANTHGSDVKGSDTSNKKKRKKKGKVGDGGDGEDGEDGEDKPVEVAIQKTETEEEIDKAKKRKAEAQATAAEAEAQVASHQAFETLSASYDKAMTALEEYENSPGFQKDSFKHKMKTAAVANLQRTIGEMMN